MADLSEPLLTLDSPTVYLAQDQLAETVERPPKMQKVGVGTARWHYRYPSALASHWDLRFTRITHLGHDKIEELIRNIS